MKKIQHDYCVIGLGRFGTAVVRKLVSLGKTVFAIDMDENVINSISGIVDYAVALDSTDIAALEGVGIREFDNIIVCMANLEANIMTCAILRDLKIPNIIAKAGNERHEKVLRAIGVNNVVRPELEAANRTALRSVYRLAIDITDVDDYHSIVRIPVKSPDIIKHTLSELNLRDMNLNIIAVQRKNRTFVPRGDDKLQLNDRVMLIAHNEKLNETFALFEADKTINQNKTSNSPAKSKTKK